MRYCYPQACVWPLSYARVTKHGAVPRNSTSHAVHWVLPHIFFSSDLGKLAKPSYQMVLEKALGIRNQSSPMLRLSHISVWWRT